MDFIFAYGYGGDDFFSAAYTLLTNLNTAYIFFGVVQTGLTVVILFFAYRTSAETHKIRQKLFESDSAKFFGDESEKAVGHSQNEPAVKPDMPAATPCETSFESPLPAVPTVSADNEQTLEKPQVKHQDVTMIADTTRKREYLEKLANVYVNGKPFSAEIFISAAKACEKYLQVDASIILDAPDIFGIIKAWPSFWRVVCITGQRDPQGASRAAVAMQSAKAMFSALPKDPEFNP